MHSVINQRQCHEQCKLGGTLCLVLLVTSRTVIQKNIDPQTFNDYKHVNPSVSCSVVWWLYYVQVITAADNMLVTNVWVSVFLCITV